MCSRNAAKGIYVNVATTRTSTLSHFAKNCIYAVINTGEVSETRNNGNRRTLSLGEHPTRRSIGSRPRSRSHEFPPHQCGVRQERGFCSLCIVGAERLRT